MPSLLADIAAALAFGALAALGQPGIDVFPLAVAALGALAYVIARRGRMLHAAGAGVAFGLALFSAIMLGSLSWGANVPLTLSLCAGIGIGLPLGLWIRFSASRFSPRSVLVLTAAAWALFMDAADALGAPLNWVAASTVAAWPFLLGGSRWVGANLTTGILVAGAVSVGVLLSREELHSRWRRATEVIGSAFGVLLLLAAVARLAAPASNGSLQVGIPQLNVPSSFFETRQAVPGASDAFDEIFHRQLHELRGVDLVALTEAYDGRFALEVPVTRERFQRYAHLERQALLLTSYLVAPNGGGYNAVAGIAPTGALVGIHRKVDLAPFGESDLSSGDRFRALPLWPNISVGAMICQESVPPRASRELTLDGAQLLVATTSDSSFGTSLLVFGHLAMTRVRAIETGRDIVWASASGPSGIIDRWGNFRVGAPLRVTAASRLPAQLHSELTPFLRARWLPPVLCAIVMFGAFRRFSTSQSEEKPLATTALAAALAGVTGALFLAAVVSVGAPALIEWRNGDPGRARAAVTELWDKPPLLANAPSYERFLSGGSVEGALAFYLDFYGPSRNAADVKLTRPVASLSDLLSYLNDVARFPGRLVPLRWDYLPRAATLIRLKGGEYAVLTTNGAGVASLFSPSHHGPIILHSSDLRRVIEPQGILPAGVPDVAAYSP